MKDRLKEHICTLLQEKGGRAVIAIDGMAASGKSTLAARLAEELDGCVIHMDDFFLPPELRTQERLSSPGGNVGLTVSKMMGIELEWVQEGKLPSYFVLVGGLLKK